LKIRPAGLDFQPIDFEKIKYVFGKGGNQGYKGILKCPVLNSGKVRFAESSGPSFLLKNSGTPRYFQKITNLRGRRFNPLLCNLLYANTSTSNLRPKNMPPF